MFIIIIIIIHYFVLPVNFLIIVQSFNETPTVRGLAADINNKLYTETMIFLWNNHYNLNFIM